jgi:hypothetical protein
MAAAMRNIRILEEMAGMRRTRQERVADRQVTRFRRQMAEREQMMLLVDKVRQRERGDENLPPMPYAKRTP